jgi:hypothetical protein
MVGQKASVAVLVTEAYPKELDRFGIIDGVWICKFADIKPLVMLLRDTMEKIYTANSAQENKGEKMETLYNYLTSHEFVGNWNAIRDGFRGLRNMLQKEREDFEKNWKKKEKQIDMIIQNSLHISGSIEGIAGQDSIDMQLNSNETNWIEE